MSQRSAPAIGGGPKRSGPCTLDYDSERGSDLSLSLSSYLETSQHHARTCAEIHFHADTPYNRLERINELIGPGWKEIPPGPWFRS